MLNAAAWIQAIMRPGYTQCRSMDTRYSEAWIYSLPQNEESLLTTLVTWEDAIIYYIFSLV
jgi:hypothetical protein